MKPDYTAAKFPAPRFDSIGLSEFGSRDSDGRPALSVGKQ